MAEIRPQVYLDPRPPESMDRFHDWARNNDPGWVYPAVRVTLGPVAALLYRTRTRGLDNIPESGGFILAPNHFSNMDHFFCGVYMRRQIRFMAKSQFFGNNRALGYIFRVAGHFPVRRGHNDEESFRTAHSILERGDCVGMYAEGGRSRSGGLGEPKAGIGRLALESGAPIVPVAIHGSAAVRGWRRGRFPRITVSYGKPFSLDKVEAPDRGQSAAAAQQIFDRVRALYEQLEAESAGEAESVEK